MAETTGIVIIELRLREPLNLVPRSYFTVRPCVCGNPELRDVGQQLRLALAETIILDFDDLPRAEVELGGAPAPSGTASGTNTDRAAQFPRLDKHADGILSRGEFSAGRAPEQAVCFFTRRDTDANGVLGREEYLPTAVPRATPE